MNRSEIIANVSEKSGINIPDCEKVMDAFEEILSNEFSRKNAGNIIDKVMNLLNYIKNSKFVTK